ncbi:MULTISPECIES: hypothetical protein [Heyndrickxia]|nr:MULTISPECIES: hypothetical protein [Heyndrickxia]MEC2341804.1 hypothetical protein [Weizmannia sp. CD-2023]
MLQKQDIYTPARFPFHCSSAGYPANDRRGFCAAEVIEAPFLAKSLSFANPTKIFSKNPASARLPVFFLSGTPISFAVCTSAFINAFLALKSHNFLQSH